LKAAWLLVLGLVGCAAAPGPQSDWEKQNAQRLGGTEEQPAPPAYPAASELIEFYVGPTVAFKFFIDPRSISVGRDKVVRYTLVARSPTGVENVSYEGMRCPDQYRIYALGRPEQKAWSVRPGDWRPIPRSYGSNSQYALARDFFCPHRDPVQTVAEAVDALQHGVHPAVEVQRSMGGGGD
jgi:hypothetical protein